jgi:hypothetical protein
MSKINRNFAVENDNNRKSLGNENKSTNKSLIYNQNAILQQYFDIQQM